MERVYHIAQFGTYDLASLGDTMFPIIFELEMKEKFNGDVKVDFYSPFSEGRPYNNLPPIRGIDELKKYHEENPYDLFVIGGGNLSISARLSITQLKE